MAIFPAFYVHMGTEISNIEIQYLFSFLCSTIDFVPEWSTAVRNAVICEL